MLPNQLEYLLILLDNLDKCLQDKNIFKNVSKMKKLVQIFHNAT